MTKPDCVVGLMFSPDKHMVLMLRKVKPEWMKDRLCGVGGKMEPGETPAAALVREFQEEAGLETTEAGWREFARTTWDDRTIHFFYTFDDRLSQVRAAGEQLWIMHVLDAMHSPFVMPNYRWMIPYVLQEPDTNVVLNVRKDPGAMEEGYRNVEERPCVPPHLWGFMGWPPKHDADPIGYRQTARKAASANVGSEPGAKTS